MYVQQLLRHDRQCHVPWLRVQSYPPFKFPTHQEFHNDKTRQLCSCKEHEMGIALHYITLLYGELRDLYRTQTEGTTIKY